MECKYKTKNGRCGLRGAYAYKHKCFTQELCNCWESIKNADKIRAMSNEELARELLFFCPTDSVFEDGKPHYTGLGGGYYLTSDEAVEGSLKWLDKPVEDTP